MVKSAGKIASDVTLLEASRGTVARALVALDRCVARVSTDLDKGGKYSAQLGSHLAYLTKHAAQILAELRKLEAHDRRMVDQMPSAERHALVAEYLRELDRDGRIVFRGILDELDAEESVLG